METLDLRSVPGRSLPGILGGHRVLGTTMLLGMKTTDDVEGHVTPLAGAGMLARAVADHAHEASAALDPIWSQWRGRVSQKYTD